MGRSAAPTRSRPRARRPHSMRPCASGNRCRRLTHVFWTHALVIEYGMACALRATYEFLLRLERARGRIQTFKAFELEVVICAFAGGDGRAKRIGPGRCFTRFVFHVSLCSATSVFHVFHVSPSPPCLCFVFQPPRCDVS